MSFLGEVKKGREPIQTKDARLAYTIPPQKAGRPYKDSWDLERAIREALQKVIPIFRAVHAIADNQSRLPVQVRDGSETGPPIDAHDLVRLLNQKPNPDESAYVFRYRLSAQVLLSRKGAFIEVVRSVGGGISALYLLNPTKTHPVPSEALSIDRSVPRGKIVPLIDHYEVELQPGLTETISASEVVRVRLPHPTDPLAGMTPLEAAGLTIDVDVLARLYNRTFLQNDGRPGGIVGVKGEMDDDVADELHDRFNMGTRGAGRITVVEADGLDFVDTAVTPRDAQYIQALAASKIDLLGAFGVPESVAYANASGRTWDNADAERAIFWESTELGHLALLGDAFNEADGDDETFTVFDTSGVDVLQRMEAKRRESMRAEVLGGTRTLDSYLEETGKDPLGTPESRSYWRPMGDVPYATEGEEAPVLSIVQEAATAAAKAVSEEYERKAASAPFRYRPRSGA